MNDEKILREGLNEEVEEEIVQEEEKKKSPEDMIKELENENLRLRADMENLRKRAHKEKIDFARYANENLLADIIPVCDNFERAVQVATDDPALINFLKGFTMIQSQLDYVLKNAGLEKIEALNQPFDPNLHEASEMAQGSQEGENVVAEVLRTGYTFGDKVIRPALVAVKKI